MLVPLNNSKYQEFLLLLVLLSSFSLFIRLVINTFHSFDFYVTVASFPIKLDTQYLITILVREMRLFFPLHKCF